VVKSTKLVLSFPLGFLLARTSGFTFDQHGFTGFDFKCLFGRVVPACTAHRHFIFTAIVTLLKTKANLLYMTALIVGTMIHFLYNWYLLGGLR
jgi:hypothetical protein